MIRNVLLLALLGVTGLLAFEGDTLVIDPEAGLDALFPVQPDSPDIVYIEDSENVPYNGPYPMVPPQEDTPYNGPAALVPQGPGESVLEPLEEPIDSVVLMPETDVQPEIREVPTAYYEDPNYNGLAYMEAPNTGVVFHPDFEHLDEVDDGAVVTF